MLRSELLIAPDHSFLYARVMEGDVPVTEERVRRGARDNREHETEGWRVANDLLAAEGDRRRQGKLF